MSEGGVEHSYCGGSQGLREDTDLGNGDPGGHPDADILEGFCHVVNLMNDGGDSSNMPEDIIRVSQVYVRDESTDDKVSVVEAEEVVLEEFDPLPNDDTLQVMHGSEDSFDQTISGSETESKVKIDKDDPRSRLHYIKYLKREGKPLKMWECGICGKEFRHQYTLMRHLPTHTDERNYKCDDCGKAFRQMSTLSQHRAIHSDARPYVCEWCKKTFNRVSTLISHRKTHSELKPHKCPMCFKGFHQKGNLRNHVFTHTNERPYKCDICEKGFNQMSNLVCHKAHVHGDKSRHICNLCGSVFMRRYALRLHEEFKHGIQYRAGSKTPVMKDDFEPIPAKSRRKDEKNLRIIHLPNGDRKLANVKDKAGENTSLTTPVHRLRLNNVVNGDVKQTPEKSSSSGVIIDPINTKAMQNAKDAGHTPFALLKPAKGIPVLVKVMPAPNNKQMLVPATVEDLKSAGKITVSPNYESPTNGNPIKAVQIKVPVVATVIQRFGENGELSITVESPGPEQQPELDEQVANLKADSSDVAEPEDSLFMSVDSADGSPNVEYLSESQLASADDIEDITSSQLLEASDGCQPEIPNEFVLESSAVEEVEEVEEEDEEATMVDASAAPGLLELANAGEIQFVRPGEGGGYQVLTQEEAVSLMQNPVQYIEVMGDNSDQQLQEMLGEEEDGELLVNQNNFSALVQAIQSNGYSVTPSALAEIKTFHSSKLKIPILQDLQEQTAVSLLSEAADGGDNLAGVNCKPEFVRDDVSLVIQENPEVSFVLDECVAANHL